MSTTTDSAKETRAESTPARRLPVGVEVIGPDTVHARVWAPAAREISIVLDGREVPLRAETAGYFSVQAEGKAGAARFVRGAGRHGVFE